MKKILVIGAGNVGAHIISQSLARDIWADFYLADLDQDLVEAQILDIKDTLIFGDSKPQIKPLDLKQELPDIDIVVITAGAKQKEGETRCDLLQKNKKILSSIAKDLKGLPKKVIIILVSNPVDILTRMAYDVFDIPKNQIIGTGTILDSARFRWRLSEELNINMAHIHGYILGEHGDSSFVPWSLVTPTVGLTQVQKEKIEKEVKEEAYTIIKGKGATYFGIGASVAMLLRSICLNTHNVFSVSTAEDHSHKDSILSTPIGRPAIINAQGVQSVLPLKLTDTEKEKMKISIQKMKDLFDSI